MRRSSLEYIFKGLIPTLSTTEVSKMWKKVAHNNQKEVLF